MVWCWCLRSGTAAGELLTGSGVHSQPRYEPRLKNQYTSDVMAQEDFYWLMVRVIACHYL